MIWVCKQLKYVTVPIAAFVLALAALLLPMGCSAAPPMKPVQVQSVSSYQLTAEQAGLGVAVDPYLETARVSQHFGTDLLTRKALPVLVVLENRSAEGVFALLPDKCALLTGEVAIAPGADDPFAVRQKTQASGTSALIGGGVIMAVPLTAVAVASIVGVVQEQRRDALDMQKNMVRLAWTPKAVYRGDSNSGFLYFRTERLDLHNSDLKMQVVVENIRTKEQVIFALRLKP